MGSSKTKIKRLPAPRRQEMQAAKQKGQPDTVPTTASTSRTKRKTRVSNGANKATALVPLRIPVTPRNNALTPVREDEEDAYIGDNDEEEQAGDPYEEQDPDYNGSGGQEDDGIEFNYNEDSFSEVEIENILTTEGNDRTYGNSLDQIDANLEPSYEESHINKCKQPIKAIAAPKKAAPCGRAAKTPAPIVLPEKIKIRLLIDVGGSATVSMVTSDNDFDEVVDTVAGVLEKDVDDLNLSYKPSWATKATPNTNLAGEADWDFLLEQICDYMLRALGKKGNAGVIPSWTIAIVDGGGEQQKGRGKKSGSGEDQNNKPKGNVYWMTALRNKYMCCGDNGHKFPCFVLKTSLYEPDFPKGHHLRLTPGAVARWAQKIDGHDAGIKTIPDDVLEEFLKNEGYKGGHKRGEDLVTLAPSKKSRKQAGFPQFTFPFIPFPSLEAFSPFKSRNSSPEDDTSPGDKRKAGSTGLEETPIDGPAISDWLPPLDEKHPDFPVVFSQLIPRTRGEGIVYLANLLEFTVAELVETLEIQLGTSKFLLRKGREELQRSKVGAKRARTE